MILATSFLAFLVLMMVVGIAASWREGGSAENYLTAGRSHNKFTIALSGAASATSGFVMIGAVGAGYSLGVMAVLMPLSWFIGDALFWTLFPRKINKLGRESSCNTIPEFVSFSTTGRRRSRIRTVLALITVVFVSLYAVGQFLAAGKAVNGAFDVSMTTAIGISAFVIVAYAARGGLKSSIPTQFVQAIIMLFTTVGMCAIALYYVGGFDSLIRELNSTNPHLLLIDGGRGPLLVTAFAAGFATTAFTFDIGQPHLLIRIMAAKSPEEAARARWIYLSFMQVTWISMSLFGLAMVVLLPNLEDAEQALPLFASETLHPVLAGAVLAGIFAAVASTLDALLLVLSSALGVDMFPNFFKRMTDRFGVWYQVAVTVVAATMTTILAILLVDSTSVFNIIVFSASGLGVTIGCAMLITVLKWRTSVLALTVSAASAIAVTAAWRAFGLSEYFLESFPGFVTGLIVHQLLVRFDAGATAIKKPVPKAN